tara:strand:- start:1071 stop:1280 length:210 start_codon:yes stop_codon:yes gene_type:complete
MAFKMKGNPMKRNFGVGESPMKIDPTMIMKAASMVKGMGGEKGGGQAPPPEEKEEPKDSSRLLKDYNVI